MNNSTNNDRARIAAMVREFLEENREELSQRLSEYSTALKEGLEEIRSGKVRIEGRSRKEAVDNLRTILARKLAASRKKI